MLSLTESSRDRMDAVQAKCRAIVQSWRFLTPIRVALGLACPA